MKTATTVKTNVVTAVITAILVGPLGFLTSMLFVESLAVLEYPPLARISHKWLLTALLLFLFLFLAALAFIGYGFLILSRTNAKKRSGNLLFNRDGDIFCVSCGKEVKYTVDTARCHNFKCVCDSKTRPILNSMGRPLCKHELIAELNNKYPKFLTKATKDEYHIDDRAG